MLEQLKSNGPTVEQRWWSSGTVMVEQCNSDGGTGEQWKRDG